MSGVMGEVVGRREFVEGVRGEGWEVWIEEVRGVRKVRVEKVSGGERVVGVEVVMEKVGRVWGEVVVWGGKGKMKEVVKEGEK